MKTVKKIGIMISALALSLSLTACAPKYAGEYEGKIDFTDSFMQGIGKDYEVEGKIECNITLDLGNDGKYTLSADGESMKNSCSDFLDNNLESIYKQMFADMGYESQEDIDKILSASDYGSLDEMVKEGKEDAMKGFENQDFSDFDGNGKYTVKDGTITFSEEDKITAEINDDGTITLIIEADGSDMKIELTAKK